MRGEARWPCLPPSPRLFQVLYLLWMARGKTEDGSLVSGHLPAESSARAVPRCAGIPARALPQPSLWPPRSVALALSAGPPRFPSPCLALPPGAERASPPPPHGASARPGLLAAGRRLPEHAPPIYRQGPPPTAISVSCQLPAAHSGRRSREPGPELSPRAGREHREPACLSAPLPVPGVLSHSPLLGAGEGPVVGCPPPSRGELGLWLQGLQAPPAAGRTGRAGAGRGTSSPQRGPRAAVA